MYRKILCEEYVDLARKFKKRGMPLEAISCALSVLRLEPASQEALKIIQKATSLSSDRVHPNRRAPSLQQRKIKLDRELFRELKVSRVSPELFPTEVDPPGKDEKEASARYEELKQRMDGLKKKLGSRRNVEVLRIRKKLQDLIDKIPATGKTGSSNGAGEAKGNDVWGELMLEHEFHSLGNLFYQINRFDEAIECYNLVLEIRPDLIESYFNRGLAYCRKSLYVKAHEDLCKVNELNPHLAEGYYTRGLICEYQERYDEAIADYDKALDVDPGYTKAENQKKTVQWKKARKCSGSSSSSGESDSRAEGIIQDFSMFIEKPDCSFEDVGGCEEALREFRKVALYLSNDPILEKWGAALPSGILLVGLPGVGKTNLVRALAGTANCPLYAPSPSVFNDMWAGNTEKNIRNFWKAAEENAPSIIFIDEIDGFCSKRSRGPDGENWYNRIVATILHLMDNIRQDRPRVVLIGATNCAENIDDAFLRAGRFKTIVVPSPNLEALAAIWLIHLSMADQRSQKVDFLSDELRNAVRADRGKWLAGNLRPARAGGILELSRLCEKKGLTGADVREIINATVDSRVLWEHEFKIDLGPITTGDLRSQIKSYRRIPAGGWNVE